MSHLIYDPCFKARAQCTPGGKELQKDRACSSTVILGTYGPHEIVMRFPWVGNEIVSPGGNIVIQAGVTALFDTQGRPSGANWEGLRTTRFSRRNASTRLAHRSVCSSQAHDAIQLTEFVSTAYNIGTEYSVHVHAVQYTETVVRVDCYYYWTSKLAVDFLLTVGFYPVQISPPRIAVLGYMFPEIASSRAHQTIQ